jgi:uncharacterized membrane-anchored protein YitT (DUF2179 family)
MIFKKAIKKSVKEIKRQRKLFLDHYIKQTILILLWVFSAAIGLKWFLLPNALFDGWVTGISLLTNFITGFSLPALIILINIPFIIIWYKQISWKFALKTAVAILLLAFLVEHLSIPNITEDKLLIAVFWGFFLGAGIGLSMRGWCVIDGTEVLAIFVSRYTTFTVGDFIWLFNICLFSVAAFLVNIETALYSMLTYIAASKTVDFVVNGIEEYIAVTIISEQHENLQKILIEEHGRKATIFKGESDIRTKWFLLDKKRKIIYCVVTRLEVPKLLYEIEQIDPEAFVVQTSVKDVKWWLVKKRPLH